MLKEIIAVSALTLTLSAPFAAAYSIISKESVTGTLESINTESRELVLKSKAGTSATVTLGSSAKVVMGSDEFADLAKLTSGQEVVINKRTLTATEDNIEGVIVSINSSAKTARVRQDSTGEIIEVQFGENVKVIDNNKTRPFASLRRGASVLIQTASN
ncbi:hypothetical protein [Teredinibacter waterburyi]|uniref:hypothetical protein n=1 Tax=Teredinibacter waterburyi TaxID=1500538 RepID=UPI00165F5867|nr:hypothetical protein [Teredinibacter waterburyi]